MSEPKRNHVYLGDNMDVISGWPDDCFDSIVTDPPYGLGKEPEALVVMRDWLDKGYHHVKGRGIMGKEWDAFVPQPNFWKECYRVLKPGGHILAFASTRTYDWMAMGIRLAGFQIRDQLVWAYGSGFPKSADVALAIDTHLGVKRKVIGKYQVDMGGKNGERFGEAGKDITVATSPEAVEWDGWGSTLKPAIEPIVMARKPLEKNMATNVLKHGVGGLNIKACEIPTDGNVEGVKGRWPANLVHDGSEDVLGVFPKTGPASTTVSAMTKSPAVIGDRDYCVKGGPPRGVTDNGGSAARYFETVKYCEEDLIMNRIIYEAKPSANERNFGLKGFEKKRTQAENTDVDSMCSGMYGRVRAEAENEHPTIKPIDLMRYLVKLVTPKGGLCLDPYLGSGTTAIAAKAEKIDYVGIEREAAYHKIAVTRIEAEVVKYDIFDFMD